MATFVFDTLNQADRDTFELSDGATIEFLNRTDFSAGQQVEAEKLGEAIENLRNTAKKSKDGRVLERLDEKNRQFVKLILPDMPDKVLNDLNAGQVGVLVQWWTDKQEERFGNRPNRRGRG